MVEILSEITGSAVSLCRQHGWEVISKHYRRFGYIDSFVCASSFADVSGLAKSISVCKVQFRDLLQVEVENNKEPMCILELDRWELRDN